MEGSTDAGSDEVAASRAGAVRAAVRGGSLDEFLSGLQDVASILHFMFWDAQVKRIGDLARKNLRRHWPQSICRARMRRPQLGGDSVPHPHSLRSHA